MTRFAFSFINAFLLVVLIVLVGTIFITAPPVTISWDDDVPAYLAKLAQELNEHS